MLDSAFEPIFVYSTTSLTNLSAITSPSFFINKNSSSSISA